MGTSFWNGGGLLTIVDIPVSSGQHSFADFLRRAHEVLDADEPAAGSLSQADAGMRRTRLK
jgi:hypothetical protein